MMASALKNSFPEKRDGSGRARSPENRVCGHFGFMQERGERYRERMADVSEKVVTHVASMDADSILTRGAQVEKIDTVARRTFGLDSPTAGSGAVNLNVLIGGRAIVQVNQKNG